MRKGYKEKKRPESSILVNNQKDAKQMQLNEKTSSHDNVFLEILSYRLY